jgi:gluconate 5-dehydrogenase
VQVGPIADSASSTADGPLAEALIRLVPRGRYATVEEVADAIVRFAGPGFDLATGAVLPLDGGLLLQLRPADIERAPAAPSVPGVAMPDR